MEAAAAGKLNVVLFPWLAFGHMIPFMELAKCLAARGHAVTFLSTPRNVARLPPVPADLSLRVRLVALPAPVVDGLPEGAVSTADMPPEKQELLKKALDGLSAPFAEFLADTVADGGRRPDWIIMDFCHHWLPAIAEAHGVPCAMFLIVQAAWIAFMGPRSANAAHPCTMSADFTVPPKWLPSFPPAITYRRHEADWILTAFRPNASRVSDFDRLWQAMDYGTRDPRTRLIIYRSCEEVDVPGVFAVLTDLFQQPAVPAGVLLQPVLDDEDDDDSISVLGARPEVLQWLAKQTPKSVIDVALGSEAPLTAKTLHELALGLEIAGVRFLWAFRQPAGMSAPFTDDDEGELLPAGFEDRTRGRGLVWPGWVPQVRVLAHAAVGAFLTHCGWGSTIEGLVFGHQLVMLPFVADQGLIARTMAERGVGVEVARDETDGSFDRDGVVEAVRRVVLEEDAGRQGVRQQRDEA
ncbi:UDP-glycosyltransferase 91C1-like [Miscanthus floridulus]|uniref:UDP-glycosyltransferase 91C1-like n=1 Tax=Miscanthus floridulus TaxID=154761 RepID=UPI00345B3EC9